jgi:hypothetical protein
LALAKKLKMPEAGHLQIKPWRQKEFSLLDPDNNLLTFGRVYYEKLINNRKRDKTMNFLSLVDKKSQLYILTSAS